MKSIIIPLIALALVVGFGIYEVISINKIYGGFEDKIDYMITLAENKSLTEEEYDYFCQEWLEVRAKSELFLPHNDVYEINLRVSETKAYVKERDYELCLGHLAVMKDLANYIRHLSKPDFSHIM